MFSTDTVEEAEALQLTFGTKVYAGELKGRYVVASVAQCKTQEQALDQLYVVQQQMVEVYQQMKDRQGDTPNAGAKVVTGGQVVDEQKAAQPQTNFTPDQEKLVLAIRSYGHAVMNSTKAVNFARGAKTAIAAEERAIRSLLKLILGRRPTQDEVNVLSPG